MVYFFTISKYSSYTLNVLKVYKKENQRKSMVLLEPQAM